jgi:transcription-repair coupling factor (superfamily II helicase)
LLVAALARTRPRDTLVVVLPTDTQARVLYDDVRAYCDGTVSYFPAWETLPFERVSPSIETMGERMRLVAQLRDNAAPQVIVAPVRALLQRLSPASLRFEPIVIRRGGTLDVDEVTRRLVEWGYVREQLTEHRGEFAMRGAILDVFGSTDDSPVRVELWGDEVERLSVFSVNDQRSTDELDEVRIYPARELLIDDDVAARAETLATDEPWGREQSRNEPVSRAWRTGSHGWSSTRPRCSTCCQNAAV